MTSEEPRQSVQSAWTLRLREEALRAADDDVSRIAYVGLLIATYADADGDRAFPSPETLATICGYSVDMVRRCIAALITAGMLLRRRRQGTTSVLRLLVPVGPVGTVRWDLAPFEAARQAAARRRARSAERTDATAEAPSRRGNQNTRRDGNSQTGKPVASGVPEHPSRRGNQESEHPSRRPENARRDGYENTRRVGGGPIPTSTYGRDPDRDQNVAGLSPQPQVRAREAANDISPPGLQAIDGGGRGTATGQGPLLLPVPTAAPVPADLARIADRMTSLYGVAIPRRFAAPVALDVLGDLDLPDPTGYVLAALDADPARYRPPLPDADTRAPRAAGDS